MKGKASDGRKVVRLFLAVLLLWLAWPWALGILVGELEARGQFGDSFGALNTLFAGLAFAGVVYTVFLQQKELSLQREELKLTRTELGRSASAQELSEKSLARQVEIMVLSAEVSAQAALLTQAEAELGRVRVMDPKDLELEPSRRQRVETAKCDLETALWRLAALHGRADQEQEE